MEIDVDPAKLNVPTGMLVAAGERYAFRAIGRWSDWFVACGPDGWGRLGPLARFNRVPGKPFFLLCGNIGMNDRLSFAIGAALAEWIVPAEAAGQSDRQLYLFANDWPSMYFNNRALPAEKGGPLRVSITRLF